MNKDHLPLGKLMVRRCHMFPTNLGQRMVLPHTGDGQEHLKELTVIMLEAGRVLSLV